MQRPCGWVKLSVLEEQKAGTARPLASTDQPGGRWVGEVHRSQIREGLMSRSGSGLSSTGGDTARGVQPGARHRIRTLAAVSGKPSLVAGRLHHDDCPFFGGSGEPRSLTHRPLGLNPGTPNTHRARQSVPVILTPQTVTHGIRQSTADVLGLKLYRMHVILKIQRTCILSTGDAKMWLLYFRNYLVGANGCLLELLLLVWGKQVYAARLLKIGRSSAHFHEMGPETLPPPFRAHLRLRVGADSESWLWPSISWERVCSPGGRVAAQGLGSANPGLILVLVPCGTLCWDRGPSGCSHSLKTGTVPPTVRAVERLL